MLSSNQFTRSRVNLRHFIVPPFHLKSKYQMNGIHIVSCSRDHRRHAPRSPHNSCIVGQCGTCLSLARFASVGLRVIGKAYSTSLDPFLTLLRRGATERRGGGLEQLGGVVVNCRFRDGCCTTAAGRLYGRERRGYLSQRKRGAASNAELATRSRYRLGIAACAWDYVETVLPYLDVSDSWKKKIWLGAPNFWTEGVLMNV